MELASPSSTGKFAQERLANFQLVSQWSRVGKLTTHVNTEIPVCKLQGLLWIKIEDHGDDVGSFRRKESICNIPTDLRGSIRIAKSISKNDLTVQYRYWKCRRIDETHRNSQFTYWVNPCTTIHLPIGKFKPLAVRNLHQSRLRGHQLSLVSHDIGGFSHFFSLVNNGSSGKRGDNNNPPIGPFEGCVPPWRIIVGLVGCVGGAFILMFTDRQCFFFLGAGVFVVGSGVWLTGHRRCQDTDETYRDRTAHGETVSQKVLHGAVFPYYNNYMANILSADKQIGIIGALCEGSSIRSIERITGVHRDTIMRLGVKVGKGCTALMDAKMRNLSCTRLEMDEIWGFIGKKDRHVRPGDDPQFGNVWTFCAIDADTKLVPAFRVGKDRDVKTTTAFVLDVADRMKNRVQISTDGLAAYVDAIDWAFGGNVDYGQIIKTYGTEESIEAQRRYSAPAITGIEKKAIFGRPAFDLISTSYVERLNATTRLHMKRLARLTHAFSKKRENFEAAVGLHFAYYNFVRSHRTLRCTPAMAAGIERSFWSVGELLEAAA